MIQLIRQDERGSIYEEYKDRVGTIVTGTIARFEGGDDDRQPRPRRRHHAALASRSPASSTSPASASRR